MPSLGVHRRRVRLVLVIALLGYITRADTCRVEQKLQQHPRNGKRTSLDHRTVLRYHVDHTAGGLINQILCHIGAFLLAVPLRAEVLLPGALSRSTFDTNWWQQEWHKEPLHSLLNVQDIIAFWRKRGILVHQVSPYPLSLQ